MRHVPVLLNEVIENLGLKAGMNVVDCTLGDAGHAEKFLEIIGTKGRLLGIDADPESLLRAKQYLYRFGDKAVFVRDNFVRLKEIIAENKFAPVNAILMDLGWSSPQFAERGRGFSFLNDEPLDMRYYPLRHCEERSDEAISASSESTDTGNQGIATVASGSLAMTGCVTAANIVNNYSEEDLAKIFKNFGEEDLAKEIASRVVASRKNKKIERTGDLVEIVLECYREKLHSDKEVPWIGGLHPSTKIFQALRIAVNDELGVLKKVLPDAVEALVSGGRLAVISFHSLEDRIVKQYFKSVENKTIKLINKKPIVAGEVEEKDNSRARSAKLRVIEKL